MIIKPYQISFRETESFYDNHSDVFSSVILLRRVSELKEFLDDQNSNIYEIFWPRVLSIDITLEMRRGCRQTFSLQIVSRSVEKVYLRKSKGVLSIINVANGYTQDVFLSRDMMTYTVHNRRIIKACVSFTLHLRLFSGILVNRLIANQSFDEETIDYIYDYMLLRKVTEFVASTDKLTRTFIRTELTAERKQATDNFIIDVRRIIS